VSFASNSYKNHSWKHVILCFVMKGTLLAGWLTGQSAVLRFESETVDFTWLVDPLSMQYRSQNLTSITGMLHSTSNESHVPLSLFLLLALRSLYGNFALQNCCPLGDDQQIGFQQQRHNTMHMYSSITYSDLNQQIDLCYNLIANTISVLGLAILTSLLLS